VVPRGAPAQVAGRWAVTVKYMLGEGQQQFILSQDGAALTGTHQGEIFQGALTGTVRAGTVELKGRMPVPGNSINWTFQGTVQGNAMSGSVDMGEYGPATFTAVRA